MLKVIKSLSQLHQEQLLTVYSGSIQSQKEENAFLSYLREDFFPQKDACYCLWVEENGYKSALRLEPYKDGLLLQALETELSARRMGYGYMLIKTVLAYLATSEYKCLYSHVDKRNIPSLNLHKKCGFQTIADTAVLLDGTVTVNSYTLCYYL